MKLFDPPCRNTEICPPGKAVWNANGGFVSVLLTHLFYFCCFVRFFCQRFLDNLLLVGYLPVRLHKVNHKINPRANSRQILHAGVVWFRMWLLPFWGLAAPHGRKKGQMKFLLLWESMGNFCILAVFERYLSNACTDPYQILFV